MLPGKIGSSIPSTKTCSHSNPFEPWIVAITTPSLSVCRIDEDISKVKRVCNIIQGRYGYVFLRLLLFLEDSETRFVRYSNYSHGFSCFSNRLSIPNAQFPSTSNLLHCLIRSLYLKFGWTKHSVNVHKKVCTLLRNPELLVQIRALIGDTQWF